MISKILCVVAMGFFAQVSVADEIKCSGSDFSKVVDCISQVKDLKGSDARTFLTNWIKAHPEATMNNEHVLTHEGEGNPDFVRKDLLNPIFKNVCAGDLERFYQDKRSFISNCKSQLKNPGSPVSKLNDDSDCAPKVPTQFQACTIGQEYFCLFANKTKLSSACNSIFGGSAADNDSLAIRKEISRDCAGDVKSHNCQNVRKSGALILFEDAEVAISCLNGFSKETKSEKCQKLLDQYNRLTGGTSQDRPASK